MAVEAPQMQQPSPVEIQQWQQGAGNARQAYDQTAARTNYMKNLATQNYGIQNRQAQFANRQQRQGFDDPYIGRGIFRSGIRSTGLTNMYTNQANEQANRDLAYGGQMGQYGLEDYLAMQTRDTTLANLQAQEYARRAALAAEIKGVA
jgi:hypothetical protein